MSSRWTSGFYWMGVTLTGVFLALVSASNSDLGWQFEHRGFPLSWGFAGAAMLAFVAGEYCHHTFRPQPREGRSSQMAPEWDAAEHSDLSRRDR